MRSVRNKSSFWYISAVENSTPTMYKFNNKPAMNKFLKSFNNDPANGYWIETIFYGKLHYQDKSTEVVEK